MRYEVKRGRVRGRDEVEVRAVIKRERSDELGAAVLESVEKSPKSRAQDLTSPQTDLEVALFMRMARPRQLALGNVGSGASAHPALCTTSKGISSALQTSATRMTGQK